MLKALLPLIVVSSRHDLPSSSSILLRRVLRDKLTPGLTQRGLHVTYDRTACSSCSYRGAGVYAWLLINPGVSCPAPGPGFDGNMAFADRYYLGISAVSLISH